MRYIPFGWVWVSTSHRRTAHRSHVLPETYSLFNYQSKTKRLDIANDTNPQARFLQKLLADRWTGAKCVLRYLRGTQKIGTCYIRGGNEACGGYADCDWVQERPDRKPATGLLFLLREGVISLKINKQSVVAKSSIEAKYIAVSFAIREDLRLYKFQQPLKLDRYSILIHVENQECLQVSKNNVLNERTKYVDVKKTLIIDNVKNGKRRLEYVSSEENTPDIMTEALVKTLFTKFRNVMDVSSRATCNC